MPPDSTLPVSPGHADAAGLSSEAEGTGTPQCPDGRSSLNKRGTEPEAVRPRSSDVPRRTDQAHECGARTSPLRLNFIDPSRLRTPTPPVGCLRRLTLHGGARNGWLEDMRQ